MSKNIIEENEHLKRCLKYATELQNDVLKVGVSLIKPRDGSTICTDRAWGAIKDVLTPIDLGKYRAETHKQHSYEYGWNACLDKLKADYPHLFREGE